MDTDLPPSSLEPAAAAGRPAHTGEASTMLLALDPHHSLYRPKLEAKSLMRRHPDDAVAGICGVEDTATKVEFLACA